MGMMSKPSIASQKSYLTFLEAGSEGPVWRSVGSVTIDGTELEHPIHLDDVRVTVTIKEARREGELKKALLELERVYRRRLPWWQDPTWWCMLTFMLGCILTKAWLLAFRPLLLRY